MWLQHRWVLSKLSETLALGPACVTHLLCHALLLVACPAERDGAPSLCDHCGGHVLVQAQWRVRAQQREGERMAALEGEWRRRDAERSEQVKAAGDHYAALARRAQQVGACLWGVWLCGGVSALCSAGQAGAPGGLCPSCENGA